MEREDKLRDLISTHESAVSKHVFKLPVSSALLTSLQKVIPWQQELLALLVEKNPDARFVQPLQENAEQQLIAVDVSRQWDKRREPADILEQLFRMHDAHLLLGMAIGLADVEV